MAEMTATAPGIIGVFQRTGASITRGVDYVHNTFVGNINTVANGKSVQARIVKENKYSEDRMAGGMFKVVGMALMAGFMFTPAALLLIAGAGVYTSAAVIEAAGTKTVLAGDNPNAPARAITGRDQGIRRFVHFMMPFFY